MCTCVISFTDLTKTTKVTNRRHFFRVQIFKILKEQKEENWRDDLPTLPTNLVLQRANQTPRCLTRSAWTRALRLETRKKKRHPWPVSCNHGDRKCSPITPVARARGKPTVSWCFQWLPPVGVVTSSPLAPGKPLESFPPALLPSVCAALSLLVFNLHHNSSKFRVSVDFLCWTIHDTDGFADWSLFVFVLVSPVVCSSSL